MTLKLPASSLAASKKMKVVLLFPLTCLFPNIFDFFFLAVCFSPTLFSGHGLLTGKENYWLGGYLPFFLTSERMQKKKNQTKQSNSSIPALVHGGEETDPSDASQQQSRWGCRAPREPPRAHAEAAAVVGHTLLSLLVCLTHTRSGADPSRLGTAASRGCGMEGSDALRHNGWAMLPALPWGYWLLCSLTT